MTPYSALRTDLFTPCQRGDFFPSGHPDSEAVLCAELSRLAYCRISPDFAFDQARIQSVLTSVGFATTVFFETEGSPRQKGTHAFLTRHPGRNLAVLVFRGTDSNDPSDITEDIDFPFEPWEFGGRVHRGFVHALADVRTRLDAELIGLNTRLLITGHSLGAAIATLVASALTPTMGDQVQLYTFGSPRVGDSDFTATISTQNNHRYVDCCDAVTRIPLPVMGYAHVGDTHYIDRDGTITLNPDDNFINADRLHAIEQYFLHYFGRSGTVQARDLADHSAINYVSGVSGTRS